MTTPAPPPAAGQVGQPAPTAPAPAPAAAPAPARLPAPLDHIWDAFARRELSRGRRDVANLIEVTLQFLLEHESKSLAPMVATLELIHSWSDGLTKELNQARRLAALHPGILPKPHPLVAITMARSESGVASLQRQTAGEPATTAAHLKAFAQSLEKQLVLIHQAEAEHTAALQAKRGALADTFRHHAALMHESANQIISALPPLPTEVAAAAAATAAAEQAAAPGEPTAAPPALGGLRRLLDRGRRLPTIDWARLSPMALARACAAALMRGYRAAPDAPEGSPEAEPVGAPPKPPPNAKPQAPS